MDFYLKKCLEIVIMEYIRKDGTKVIVDGDKVKYEELNMQKNIIGANFIHGIISGGYLSSFNGSFTDELIGIQSGLVDIVNAKIGNIKDAYELFRLKISNIDNNDIYAISGAILETVDEYFGGFANIESRMDYYYPDDYEESKNNAISNLKGTGAAMCVERAALSQNLLASIGINSFFKTSGIMKNDIKDVHSYNLIEYQGKYYIFDTAIPNLINGQVSPLIAEIDKESFDLLSSPISDFGISVTVSHYNPYRNYGVTITYDSNREKHIEVDPLTSKNSKQL